MLEPSKMNIATGAVHVGQTIDPTTGAVVQPLITSTTFARDSEGQLVSGRDIYTRASNPNRRSVEAKLAWLEGGIDALAFSSGQAAAYAVFQSLGTGTHVLLPDDMYYNTKLLIDDVFGSWGLTYSRVDMTNPTATEAAIQSNTRLIWIETPSNPQLRITPIQEIVAVARKKGLRVVCDNTWSTPYCCQPLTLGADLVMHSTTKYLGGHSDILGGVLVAGDSTDTAWWQTLRQIQTLGGGVPSPFDCWLLQRSLSTFPLRMQAHCFNAQALASYLVQHPAIEAVYYPGLPSHPGYEIAQKQKIRGDGGMVSVLIKGDLKATLHVAQKLQLFTHATSLGGVESLVEHRKSVEGIHSMSPETLLRISVGIEDHLDLISDWEQALNSIYSAF